MTVFEQACLISNQRRADLLPTQTEGITFSKKHQRYMNNLFDKMRDGYYHRFTKRATVALIAAVMVLIMTATAFAIPASRDFIIDRLTGHAFYSIDAEGYYDVTDLHIGYIPEGFEKTDSNFTSQVYDIEYYNESGDEYIIITKSSNKEPIDIDTEHNIINEIEHNGRNYISFSSTVGSGRYNIDLLWNDGRYIYMVDGNVPLEELLKIADEVN